MSPSQNSSTVPLVSSYVDCIFIAKPSSMQNAQSESAITVLTASTVQNIQFFIEFAQGLPEPPTADIRNKRIVRASCSRKCSKRKNYRTSASTLYKWEDNTSQIGPVFGTDEITFSVELHAPLRMVKRFVNTIATSDPYKINNLLEMQLKAGDNNISIPLLVNKKRDNQDAFLLLRVKQPTAAFISEQLQERFYIGKKAEKEGRLSESSSVRTSISEP